MNLSRSPKFVLGIGPLLLLGGLAPRTAAAPAPKAFCAAVVELSGTAASLDGPASAVAGAKKMQTTMKGITAPASVAKEWALIAKAIDTAAGGKGDALFDDALLPALAAIGLHVADNCGYTKVTVRTTENRFSGVPASIKAGVVSFKHVNAGKEAHVLSIFRRKAGATTPTAEVIKAAAAADKAKQDSYAVVMKTFEGVNGWDSFAVPGKTSADNLRLVPGSYVMVDAVAVGEDGTRKITDDYAEKHYARGMWVEFTVK